MDEIVDISLNNLYTNVLGVDCRNNLRIGKRERDFWNETSGIHDIKKSKGNGLPSPEIFGCKEVAKALAQESNGSQAKGL